MGVIIWKRGRVIAKPYDHPLAIVSRAITLSVVRMIVKVEQVAAQPSASPRTHLEQLPKVIRIHRTLLDIVQIVLDDMLVVTYFESTVHPILHDGDELLVREQPIAVLVEDGKHGVDQVRVQLGTGANFHRSGKLIWQGNMQKKG